MRFLALLVVIAIAPSALSPPGERSAASAWPGEEALIAPFRPPPDPDPLAPAPGYFDLSEFMMGSVAVAIFVVESAGSAYDWSDAEVTETLDGISAGLAWWASLEPKARLSFKSEVHVREPTSWEPIQNSINDDTRWIDEILGNRGYSEADPWAKAIHFNNDLRSRLGTDWAYSLFVVDSDDAENLGRFNDDMYAHAYLGGPWLTMSRYSSWAFNSGNYFRAVPAHETAHIFYATDEYDTAPPEYSGYLNCPDKNGATGIMNRNSLVVSASTRCQIGWVDADGNGVLDILDVPPETTIIPRVPDPTKETQVTYSGEARVVALPNRNPYGPGNDVTVSRVTSVSVRSDRGPWEAANAVDGAFDAPSELYAITLRFRLASAANPLPAYVARETFAITANVLGPAGTHAIEARAHNTENGVDPTPALDSLQVLGPPASSVELTYSWQRNPYVRYGIDTAEPWSWTVNSSSLEGDGFYEFRTIAEDGKGDVESKPMLADASTTVDTTSPATAYALSGPSGNDGWFTGPVEMTLTASDATSGVGSTTFRVDGNAWLPYTGSLTVAGDAVHHVEFGSLDLAGNAEPSRSVEVKIDASPPEFVAKGPSGTLRSSTVEISWLAEDSVAGISRYDVSVDGSAFRAVGRNTSLAMAVADGDHIVLVRAFDVAGNLADVEVRFRVDSNLFSPTGPYGPAPLLTVVAAGVGVALLLFRRRRRGTVAARPSTRTP